MKAKQEQMYAPGHEPGPSLPDMCCRDARLDEAALAAGALDRRTKQLVALAIAVTRGCDSSITAHARDAARSGANEAEIADVLGVAMNAGPGGVHGPGASMAFGVSGGCRADPPARDGLVIVG